MMVCSIRPKNQLPHGTSKVCASCLAMAPGLCVVCLNPGDCKRCACGAGWYCSRTCQKHDWASSEEPHRDVCPLHIFKGVCNSYNIPSRVREVILSFITKPAHGGFHV
jgi:hypothetical protein